MNESADLPKNSVRASVLLVCCFAAAKAVLHLCTSGPGVYGYFRDEFYYLDCASNLALGYVDHPPLSIFMLWLTLAVFGPSVYAIRMPVILAGMATIALTAFLTREMRGGLFAQFLACLCLLTAPVYLTMSSFFSMNAFDYVFWTIAACLLVRIIHTGNANLWLWFGVVAGLGLENKLSVGFLGAALGLAILLTPERRFLACWQLWAGGLIAFLLILPHIAWQAANDWPTREFMRNATQYKNLPTTILKFFLGQLLTMSPAALLLWLPGILFGLFSSAGQKYRVFSYIYLALFFIFWWTNGKSYYLAPVYPMVVILGAIWWERVTARRTWLRAIPAILLMLLGGLLLPYAVPLLPPQTFLAYQNSLGIKAPQQERAHSGPLPQHIGDRLGWEELVAFLGKAYNDLPESDRKNCALFVSNYGEAGAVNLFGSQYGLPHAISGYMTNYLWGPRGATGDVMLVYWDDAETLKSLFEDVKEIAVFQFPFVMDRQNNRPLYLCHRLRVPMAEAWPLFKLYR